MCSNINGLRNNFTELKYVIREKKPKIIFLNETHLTNECDISDLKISGYNFINCLSHSKHTGGVCVFVDKNLKYSNVLLDSQQVAWYLSFEMNVNKLPTIFACVYLSSNNEHKKQTLDSLDKWFESIPTNKEIMICGDFNIDLISNTTHSRRLKDFCDNNGLSCLVDSPTRITDNSSTIIDLCLSNIYVNRISCNVSYDDQISDHAILYINVRGNSENSVTKKRKIRIWDKYNEIDLWNNLENNLDSWTEIEHSDVNIKMNWFINVVSAATNQFKKIKEISTKNDFFDNELELMRREKNRLYKIAQFSTTDTVIAENWHKYRLFKNEYKKMIQTKKFEYNQRKLNRVQGNNKETWKVLNSILNKENNEITHIKVNENIIDNDQEITNIFNKYFVDSIVELNEGIPIVPFVNDVPVDQDLHFEFRAVSITEIKTCLRELKNNTDEFFINPNVLLDAIHVVGQQLVNIINQSFESGVFPEVLKKSTIVPIQKKSDSAFVSDHRPINTLPCCERLLESLAFNQFNDFIEKNNILSPNQSGFRSKHSCETAINDILFDWKIALNDSKVIIIVFLDFSRAFETIDPEILLLMLASYGVSGATLEWFKNYLIDRTQVVKLGEAISEVINNKLGVPQGSILGPLLFIIYTNIVAKCLEHCKAKLFADDTALYVVADSIEDATRKINHDLNSIFNKLCQTEIKY